MGCMGLHALKYYYRLEYAYQEYYHQHYIVVSNKPIFTMTRMETTLDHVVNRVHAKLEQWKQLMDYYHELICFINLGDRAMETVTWRVI
jgi:hypothetical protein